jgi:hypothetical protein
MGGLNPQDMMKRGILGQVPGAVTRTAKKSPLGQLQKHTSDLIESEKDKQAKKQVEDIGLTPVEEDIEFTKQDIKPLGDVGVPPVEEDLEFTEEDMKLQPKGEDDDALFAYPLDETITDKEFLMEKIQESKLSFTTYKKGGLTIDDPLHDLQAMYRNVLITQYKNHLDQIKEPDNIKIDKWKKMSLADLEDDLHKSVSHNLGSTPVPPAQPVTGKNIEGDMNDKIYLMQKIKELNPEEYGSQSDDQPGMSLDNLQMKLRKEIIGKLDDYWSGTKYPGDKNAFDDMPLDDLLLEYSTMTFDQSELGGGELKTASKDLYDPVFKKYPDDFTNVTDEVDKPKKSVFKKVKDHLEERMRLGSDVLEVWSPLGKLLRAYKTARLAGKQKQLDIANKERIGRGEKMEFDMLDKGIHIAPSFPVARKGKPEGSLLVHRSQPLEKQRHRPPIFNKSGEPVIVERSLGAFQRYPRVVFQDGQWRSPGHQTGATYFGPGHSVLPANRASQRAKWNAEAIKDVENWEHTYGITWDDFTKKYAAYKNNPEKFVSAYRGKDPVKLLKDTMKEMYKLGDTFLSYKETINKERVAKGKKPYAQHELEVFYKQWKDLPGLRKALKLSPKERAAHFKSLYLFSDLGSETNANTKLKAIGIDPRTGAATTSMFPSRLEDAVRDYEYNFKSIQGRVVAQQAVFRRPVLGRDIHGVLDLPDTITRQEYEDLMQKTSDFPYKDLPVIKAIPEDRPHKIEIIRIARKIAMENVKLAYAHLETGNVAMPEDIWEMIGDDAEYRRLKDKYGKGDFKKGEEGEPVILNKNKKLTTEQLFAVRGGSAQQYRDESAMVLPRWQDFEEARNIGTHTIGRQSKRVHIFQEAIKALGFTGARIKDEAGSTTAMIDPTAIRAPWASFDPKKKGWANILASILAGGLITKAMLKRLQKEDKPKQRTRDKKQQSRKRGQHGRRTRDIR